MTLIWIMLLSNSCAVISLFGIDQISTHSGTTALRAFGPSKASPIFAKMHQTPQGNLGPESEYIPNFIQFWQRFTMWLKLWRSVDRANSNQTRDLQSFGHVVEHWPNSIKVGIHSPFGPRSPVEFEEFCLKKWAGLMYKKSGNEVQCAFQFRSPCGCR